MRNTPDFKCYSLCWTEYPPDEVIYQLVCAIAAGGTDALIHARLLVTARRPRADRAWEHAAPGGGPARGGTSYGLHAATHTVGVKRVFRKI